LQPELLKLQRKHTDKSGGYTDKVDARPENERVTGEHTLVTWELTPGDRLRSNDESGTQRETVQKQ
jgi:hypothetical protein